jgi:hypothetical protein
MTLALSAPAFVLWGVMIGGLMTGGFSILTVWLTRQSSLDAIDKTFAKQFQLAREERLHRRLETAYVEILQGLYLVMTAVERLEPIMAFENAPGPPPDPTDQEAAMLRARGTAFASQTVKALLSDLWGPVLREFLVKVSMLRRSRGPDGSGVGDIDLWHEVEEKRKELSAVLGRIEVQIASELTG